MTKNYRPHVFALCALFTLGDLVLYTQNIIYFLAASVLAVFFAGQIKSRTKSKAAFYITSGFVCVSALYGAGTAFVRLLRFLKIVLLPNTAPILVVALLSLVVIAFLFFGQKALFKYSLFVAIICGAIVMVCFIMGVKNYDFSQNNNLLHERLNIGDCLSALPLFVLPFYLKNETASAKTIIGGAATGSLMLGACCMQARLTMGTGKVSFPYLKSVSVISSGSLFTRVDGLVYFLFFVTCVIKIVVCIKTIENIIVAKCNNLGKKCNDNRLKK